MNFDPQVRALKTLTSDLAKAESFKDKIRVTDRIFEILGQCEKMVEQSIIADITGQQQNGNSYTDSRRTDPSGKPFKNLKLAAIGKLLLAEHAQLHGKQIEELAKAGGFKSNSEKFQSYLAVAFKREGGFENIGQNRWRLNERIPPENRTAQE